MTRDFGVAGDYMDRAFRKMESIGWTSKGAEAQRAAAKRALKVASSKLRQVQAARPLKARAVSKQLALHLSRHTRSRATGSGAASWDDVQPDHPRSPPMIPSADADASGLDERYPPVVRLWTLRALMRTNAVSAFVDEHRFQDVAVARLLGWTDAAPPGYSKAWALKELPRSSWRDR